MDNVTQTDDRARSLRAGRYVARTFLWSFSSLARVSRCGRVASGQLVAVKVTRSADGGAVASWSGLQHCGSPWSCPMCSAKISRERVELISSILDAWSASGGRVVMVTLTVRHTRRHLLRDTWDAVAKSWHAATSGRGWQDLAALYGVRDAQGRDRLHYVRVVETTVGEDHGWHVHVHALVMLRAGLADYDQAAQHITSDMWERWNRSAGRRGYVGGSFAACDGHVVHGDAAKREVGEYFAKAVFEVLLGGGKRGKDGHYTPFEVLAMLADLDGGCEPVPGAPDAAVLMRWWIEWEQGSRGRRQIGLSRGLTDLVEVDPMRSDEEIAEDDSLAGEVVVTITAKEFGKVVRLGCWVQVLERIEDDTASGVRFLLHLLRR